LGCRDRRGRLSKTVGTERFNFLGTDHGFNGQTLPSGRLLDRRASVLIPECPTQTARPEQAIFLPDSRIIDRRNGEGRQTLSLNLEQKQAVVAEISAQLAKAQAVILAEYRNLPVGDMTTLRKKARSSGVYLRVLKNTLVRRAVAGTPFKGLVDKMVGPLAYGISSDAVAAAKVLHEFSRYNDKLVIKAGAMPNVMMTPREVADLARLPSRQELLTKLVATLQAPIAKFVRTLNEVPGRFVRTVAAVRDRNEKQAA
jgi:large subunit ribosomal protein L10